MAKIIDLYSKINERLEAEERKKREERERIRLKKEEQTKEIREFEKKEFFIKKLEENRPYCHSINYDLVFDGWIPYAVLPLNKDYFFNRKRFLSLIGEYNIREERELFKYTEEPCIVMYKKEESF